MKNYVIKFLCVAYSIILFLTSCSISSTPQKGKDFNIENEEHLIKITMTKPMMSIKYTFLLTPDNRILAEYIDKNNTAKKFQTELNYTQRVYMKEYIDKVLFLTEKDIEGHVYFTDFWRVNIQFKDINAHFDYGASKSTDVNILIEQIIGCCDPEKELKTAVNLLPAPTYLRKHQTDFTYIEEEKE